MDAGVRGAPDRRAWPGRPDLDRRTRRRAALLAGAQARASAGPGRPAVAARGRLHGRRHPRRHRTPCFVQMAERHPAGRCQGRGHPARVRHGGRCPALRRRRRRGQPRGAGRDRGRGRDRRPHRPAGAARRVPEALRPGVPRRGRVAAGAGPPRVAAGVLDDRPGSARAHARRQGDDRPRRRHRRFRILAALDGLGRGTRRVRRCRASPSVGLTWHRDPIACIPSAAVASGHAVPEAPADRGRGPGPRSAAASDRARGAGALHRRRDGRRWVPRELARRPMVAVARDLDRRDARLAGSSPDPVAHVELRRDQRARDPSAGLDREALDGDPARGHQRRAVRTGDLRPGGGGGHAADLVGFGVRDELVRRHPPPRRGPEDALPPGRDEQEADVPGRSGRLHTATDSRGRAVGAERDDGARAAREASRRRGAPRGRVRGPEGQDPRTDLTVRPGSIGVVIVDHVYYWTRDMGRALAFYTDVVGLALLRRDGDEWAELDGGPVKIALHGTEDEPPASGTVVLKVDNLDETRWTLEQRGAVFDTYVGEVEGYARFATFRDPDGNPVQIIEYAGGG